MKENKIEIFTNTEFGSVRTLETTDGKTLFCGADVAKALGYKDTVNALKTHCKEDGVAIHHIIDNIGRTQRAKFLQRAMCTGLSHTANFQMLNDLKLGFLMKFFQQFTDTELI